MHAPRNHESTNDPTLAPGTEKNKTVWGCFGSVAGGVIGGAGLGVMSALLTYLLIKDTGPPGPWLLFIPFIAALIGIAVGAASGATLGAILGVTFTPITRKKSKLPPVGEEELW